MARLAHTLCLGSGILCTHTCARGLLRTSSTVSAAAAASAVVNAAAPAAVPGAACAAANAAIPHAAALLVALSLKCTSGSLVEGTARR